jgi:hypothetical protein
MYYYYRFYIYYDIVIFEYKIKFSSSLVKNIMVLLNIFIKNYWGA